MTDYVEPTDTAYPLTLDVNRLGSGGVAGLTPLVAIRRLSDGLYLDFADSTFKSSGWTTRRATMAAAGLSPGHYERSLNVSVLGLANGTKLAIEVNVTNGTDIALDGVELLEVSTTASQVTRLRKGVTNRTYVDSATDPANTNLVTLDDDGTTVLHRQLLRDRDGRRVVPASGDASDRGPDT